MYFLTGVCPIPTVMPLFHSLPSGGGFMSEVGWLAAGGQDVTAQFHELLPVVELEHLKAFEVLTVPGIFTAWYPRYFAAIERGLTPLRVRRSRVDTEGTVEDNAGILASEICAPTIVVAQSKGPLDVHAALWMYPSAARNVRAFVSLQGCFSGTPLASDARRTRLWRAAVGGVTRLLGSMPRAYWDMTYERRQALLARIPQHSVAGDCLRSGWTSAGAHEAILARRASGRVGWIRARAGRRHPRFANRASLRTRSRGSGVAMVERNAGQSRPHCPSACRTGRRMNAPSRRESGALFSRSTLAWNPCALPARLVEADGDRLLARFDPVLAGAHVVISVRTERLPFAELFERPGIGDLLSLENHHGSLGWQI